METIVEPQTYTYDQLTPTAQEQVKQWWYEHGAEHEWWDCVYDDAKSEGYQLGFIINDINFSGFYSQGDGACWEGQVDLAQWLKTHTEDSIGREAWLTLIREEYCDKHLGVSFSGRYSHSNTMRCNGLDWVDDIDGFGIKDEDAFLQGDSIFNGMRYTDLHNIIRSSGFPYTDPNDLEEAMFESAKDYADKIYQQLKREYEYITSEENLIEMCSINEWKFNKEGEMV